MITKTAKDVLTCGEFSERSINCMSPQLPATARNCVL